MNQLNLDEVTEYVENHISSFHSKRLKSLEGLKLTKIIQRKNPYLFKAKSILTAQDIVKVLLDAHLSSQEETIFGELLEGLAIFICDKVYNGGKSSAEGVDLEFTRDNIKYIVAIKSGPNWGNSSQIARMVDNFKKAKKILSTNTSKINIVAINGCCYGRDNQPDKGTHLKYCGQRFWEFISGNEKLYIEIVEPLSHQAKEQNEKFYEAYSQLINKFTIQFGNEFCDDGVINWQKIIEFNSSIEQKTVKSGKKQNTNQADLF